MVRNIRQRWKAKMPKFFKWIVGLGSGIAAVALAIQMSLNSAGANIPDWWTTLYPYLIGAGAGMSAVAKLTQE